MENEDLRDYRNSENRSFKSRDEDMLKITPEEEEELERMEVREDPPKRDVSGEERWRTLGSGRSASMARIKHG